MRHKTRRYTFLTACDGTGLWRQPLCHKTKTYVAMFAGGLEIVLCVRLRRNRWYNQFGAMSHR